MPLDGGSQWPPYSVWYQVAAIFLVWAPVEDWETVDGSPDSIEKVLQAVRSHFLNKVAGTATGTVGWIFLTPLKANMNSAVCCTSTQCAEMLGRTRATYIGVRTNNSNNNK